MTLLILERANLFCGIAATNSLHLELVELKLPAMVETYIDHRPGGAVMEIEIDVIFNKLECNFRLLGWDSQVQMLIGSWEASQQTFTALGLLRDQITGKAIQAMAQMRGRLGIADPQNFRVGDPMTWNYSIKGIMAYSLTVAGQNVYYWDFLKNSLTVGDSSLGGDVPPITTVP
jgi:P2 family phage contractile tail tube protein